MFIIYHKTYNDKKTNSICILYNLLCLVFLYSMKKGLVYSIINMSKFNTCLFIVLLNSLNKPSTRRITND
jgi:hypothetical protein